MVTPLDLTTSFLVTGSRYVNVATGSNTSNNCTSSGSPCKTITHAMAMATSGDTINVAPGTYNPAAGEVFPILLKSGVQLKSTAGAATTRSNAAKTVPE